MRHVGALMRIRERDGIVNGLELRMCLHAGVPVRLRKCANNRNTKHDDCRDYHARTLFNENRHKVDKARKLTPMPVRISDSKRHTVTVIVDGKRYRKIDGRLYEISDDVTVIGKGR